MMRAQNVIVVISEDIDAPCTYFALTPTIVLQQFSTELRSADYRT